MDLLLAENYCCGQNAFGRSWVQAYRACTIMGFYKKGI